MDPRERERERGGGRDHYDSRNGCGYGDRKRSHSRERGGDRGAGEQRHGKHPRHGEEDGRPNRHRPGGDSPEVRRSKADFWTLSGFPRQSIPSMNLGQDGVSLDLDHGQGISM